MFSKSLTKTKPILSLSSSSIQDFPFFSLPGFFFQGKKWLPTPFFHLQLLQPGIPINIPINPTRLSPNLQTAQLKLHSQWLELPNYHFNYSRSDLFLRMIQPDSATVTFTLPTANPERVNLTEVPRTNGASKLLRANGSTLMKVREEAVKLIGKPYYFFFSPEHPPLTESAQKVLDWLSTIMADLGFNHENFTLRFLPLYVHSSTLFIQSESPFKR